MNLIQVRNNKTIHKLEYPFCLTAELDFRDDETVWVWVNDDLCVELNKQLVNEIKQHFDEDFKEDK